MSTMSHSSYYSNWPYWFDLSVSHLCVLYDLSSAVYTIQDKWYLNGRNTFLEQTRSMLISIYMVMPQGETKLLDIGYVLFALEQHNSMLMLIKCKTPVHNKRMNYGL